VHSGGWCWVGCKGVGQVQKGGGHVFGCILQEGGLRKQACRGVCTGWALRRAAGMGAGMSAGVGAGMGTRMGIGMGTRMGIGMGAGVGTGMRAGVGLTALLCRQSIVVEMGCVVSSTHPLHHPSTDARCDALSGTCAARAGVWWWAGMRSAVNLMSGLRWWACLPCPTAPSSPFISCWLTCATGRLTTRCRLWRTQVRAWG